MNIGWKLYIYMEYMIIIGDILFGMEDSGKIVAHYIYIPIIH
jgi:hypothetical protein